MAKTVTNELIYEVLKRMQTDISGLRHDVDEVKTVVKSIRLRDIAQQQDNIAYDSRIARLEANVETINRRLDLSET